MENSALYVVSRDADQWVFVPSRTFAGGMIGGFGAGSAFMVYLSTIFFRHAGVIFADLWIGAIFLLVAGLSAVLAIRAWRTRRTPLRIESNGRVSYGERELCAAGTVRAVRISGARGGEASDCEVGLELAEGRTVSIPSQYFAGLTAPALARPFAAELAKALGVQVTESR